MKVLKIENKKGLFYDEEERKYKTIKEIRKEDILSIALQIVETNAEFEAYEEDKIVNHAEKIIYKRLSEEFEKLVESRESILNSVDERFKELNGKYKKELEPSES